MSRVRSLALRLTGEGPALGGALLSNSARKGLRKLRAQALGVLIVTVVVLMVLIGICIFIVLTNVGNPGVLAAASGAMGISTGGALVSLRAATKEWAQAGLLLVLLEDATEAQVDHVLRTIARKYL